MRIVIEPDSGQKLSSHYAALPDEDLLKLSREADSLTAQARERLAFEIAKRNLAPLPLTHSHLPDTPEDFLTWDWGLFVGLTAGLVGAIPGALVFSSEKIGELFFVSFLGGSQGGLLGLFVICVFPSIVAFVLAMVLRLRNARPTPVFYFVSVTTWTISSATAFLMTVSFIR